MYPRCWVQPAPSAFPGVTQSLVLMKWLVHPRIAQIVVESSSIYSPGSTSEGLNSPMRRIRGFFYAPSTGLELGILLPRTIRPPDTPAAAIATTAVKVYAMPKLPFLSAR